MVEAPYYQGAIDCTVGNQSQFQSLKNQTKFRITGFMFGRKYEVGRWSEISPRILFQVGQFFHWTQLEPKCSSLKPNKEGWT